MKEEEHYGSNHGKEAKGVSSLTHLSYSNTNQNNSEVLIKTETAGPDPRNPDSVVARWSLRVCLHFHKFPGPGERL